MMVGEVVMLLLVCVFVDDMLWMVVYVMVFFGFICFLVVWCDVFDDVIGVVLL